MRRLFPRELSDVSAYGTDQRMICQQTMAGDVSVAQLHSICGHYSTEPQKFMASIVKQRVFKRCVAYVTFQLAEVAVPRSLFQKILELINDLRQNPVPA